MNERTLRARMLLGEEAMEKLAGSHVAVFGLGGVGSWCAEALARAGVGRLTLIDQDTASSAPSAPPSAWARQQSWLSARWT